MQLPSPSTTNKWLIMNAYGDFSIKAFFCLLSLNEFLFYTMMFFFPSIIEQELMLKCIC